VGHDERARTRGVEQGHGGQIQVDAGDVTAVQQGHDGLAEPRCMLHLQFAADEDADDAGTVGVDLQHLGRPLLGHGRSWLTGLCDVRRLPAVGGF
jgi:hypothetical protein